jgi:putative endonuclease
MPRRGTDAERRAANHYRLRGFRVLDRNAWVGGYELDLVVRRGRRLVFVEVKEKTGTGFGDPLEMIDEEKQRRVAHAVESWLAQRPALDGLDVRLEAVAVRPDGIRRVSF